MYAPRVAQQALAPVKSPESLQCELHSFAEYAALQRVRKEIVPQCACCAESSGTAGVEGRPAAQVGSAP
jgi:hypothetical protein